jgi:hypothetical protein
LASQGLLFIPQKHGRPWEIPELHRGFNGKNIELNAGILGDFVLSLGS